MTGGRRIAVAMSGGVDSSVAAALLANAGEDVIGIMLRLWSGGPSGTNRCCSPDDMARARSIAGQLGIPFYAIDVQDRFKSDVVDFFVDGYTHGVTPNPCMECNRSIRWDFLLDHALALGATHMATGHYARVRQQNGTYQLLRAVDRSKDQSYVLSVMGQPQLAHAVFPLGDLTKVEVRQHARELELPVADRSDSQDLCFAGSGDYRTLLQHMNVKLPPPGSISNLAGDVIGTHDGLAFYTIGQRKGIGISAPHPLYVIEKDIENNRLVVGPREALGRSTFLVDRVNWVEDPPTAPLDVKVRVRYQAAETGARVTPQDGPSAQVNLAEPIPDVTPGQAAVFYQGERCLGGGLIRA
ncbi:MAG: tRNA 2-thiouridine(34) synthase MnmA [Anaerolineales bacterium]